MLRRALPGIGWLGAVALFGVCEVVWIVALMRGVELLVNGISDVLS